MRRRLTTSDPTGFCTHDHVAWCGDGPEPLHQLAVSAFSTALQRGERMVLVSEDPDPEHLAGLDDLEALVARGTLQLSTVEDAYREISDAAGLLARFEGLLDLALSDGHSGVCVVADNSRFVGGSDAEFASWLAWEALADQLQATRQVNGVCYFDRQQVSDDRLADLAILHPVLSTDFAEPSFQLLVDGDAVMVVGTVDSFCAEQLRRVLASAPLLVDSVLDLSGIEFMDHQALLAFDWIARRGHPVRLRGARPIVRRLWELLDLAPSTLELC